VFSWEQIAVGKATDVDAVDAVDAVLVSCPSLFSSVVVSFCCLTIWIEV